MDVNQLAQWSLWIPDVGSWNAVIGKLFKLNRFIAKCWIYKDEEKEAANGPLFKWILPRTKRYLWSWIRKIYSSLTFEFWQTQQKSIDLAKSYFVKEHCLSGLAENDFHQYTDNTQTYKNAKAEKSLNPPNIRNTVKTLIYR